MGTFDPPSTGTLFLASPLIYFLRPVYRLLSQLRLKPLTHLPSQSPIRVVCVSDTHNLHDTLETVPDGDLLIYAGDLTNDGTIEELQTAIDWLKSLPHPHKVAISGNHDYWLDKSVRSRLRGGKPEDEDAEDGLSWGPIHYLENSRVTLQINNRILTIHGIPQIPCLDPSPSSVHAFQYPPDIKNTPYAPPPASTDILVTHSPAKHHKDNFPFSPGCPHLLRTIWDIKPALHVHGHLHADPGVERAYYDSAQSGWESLLGRREEGEGTPIWERGEQGWMWWLFVHGAVWKDVCSVFGAWVDTAYVLVGTAWGIVCGWMGMARPLGTEGWIVNAACMDGGKSGKLTGKGIVVEL